MGTDRSWYLITIIVHAFAISDAQHPDGPVILHNDTQIVLENDQNFTLICKGKRPVNFVMQEIAEDLIANFTTSQSTYTTDDPEYPYRAVLELAHVNEFAVRYYACYDDRIDVTDLLTDIREEQKNDEHVSFIYVYVNGTGSLLTSLRSILVVRDYSFVVGCRPTMPDIEVTLISQPQSDKPNVHFSKQFFPKVGFIVKTDRLYAGILYCEARKGNKTVKNMINTNAYPPPKPMIRGSRYFFEGETVSLNCTARCQKNLPVMLQLHGPYRNLQEENSSKISIETNEQNVTEGILYKSVTIVGATREDAGTYVCISKSGTTKNTTFAVKMLTPEESFINLTQDGHESLIETDKPAVILGLKIDAYPPVDLTLKKNDYVVSKNKKYMLTLEENAIRFVISNLTVYDTANYTIIASNKYVTSNITFEIRKTGEPIIDFGRVGDKRYLQNARATILCHVYGYPLPQVTWYFKPFFCDDETCNEETIRSNDDVQSMYEILSYINISAFISGNLTCTAKNNRKTVSQTRRFLVYEIENGFGIKDKKNDWFPEHDSVTLTCLASKFEFTNVTWASVNMDNDALERIEHSENLHSHVTKLRIPQISNRDAGVYTCTGFRNNHSVEYDNINITVDEMRSPVISDQNVEQNEEVKPYLPVDLYCSADAVPPPTITWYKDDMLLQADENNTIITVHLRNHSTVESILSIRQMQEEDKGKYRCLAVSDQQTAEKIFNLTLKEKSTYKEIYLSIIGVICFLLVILTVYLIWKIRKEKEFKRELNKAGLLHFKEGATHSLNPDLAIDDQAELLPYDEKFEFPPEKLTLGKQLGSGAYGVVYKAEARGIINAEETTTVAVKMVKKTADNMYIKALISELKIMVHLGKHINILNLLGACTKNVGKRELSVIMEYCKFGSIDIYMKQHREVFVNQLTDGEKNGFGRINRGFSCSSGNSGSHSDYSGSNHTQATDHTFLTTGNTGKRKESESDYIQAEWRSNYVIEYEGRILRPLYSRDLLCWAFQIARGMEYLASRKVLHGDLAARNVLLAEDNVVKICDFGLAKSIYKNDEYQKKGNIPLPVKWLAIECITDRTFSTQSDVWAFGIVMWELFTLAKTPYPNMHHTHLLPWLLEGNRLSKPRYADDRLYKLMLQCWEQSPTARPSFTQLQEILGSFLEDSVRNHYVDLNAPYLDMNAEKNEGQEDYLAMASAPDYNNMMRPRYTNTDNLLLPPNHNSIPSPLLLHDEEGYLQMSPSPKNQVIFSPRPQSDRFDFDAHKFNVASEASSHGSELTPMLTLNNLPTRGGSESDHEGGTSPYLNMCPRIEEETDEVFETKENLKNVTQNKAITNPTYIACDISLEKIPQDINYANIPNGLVN